MKKLFFALSFMMMAIGIQAQMKTIQPKYQVGDHALYRYESTTTITSENPVTVKITYTEDYTVREADANGAIIDLVKKDVKVEGAEENIMVQLMSMGQQFVDGVIFKLKTDATGKIIDIVNKDELAAHINGKAEETATQMLAKMPELAQATNKDELKEQLLEQVSAEALLNGFQNNPNIFALNGKTLMTGTVDSYENQLGMKMNRLFMVKGNQVKSSGSLNLSKDELKELILSQVPEEQAEMVRQNIDLILNSGQIKAEMKEDATYEYLDNGWVGSISVEESGDIMGQKQTGATKLTLLEHSW
jgi:hypothetical protein